MKDRIGELKMRLVPAWRSLKHWLAGHRIAVLAAGLLLLVIALVLAAVTIPRRTRYYTDEIGVRQLARQARARLVVWERPEAVDAPFNVTGDVYEPVVSRDGRLLVFTRGRAQKNADIYMSHFSGGRWQDPVPVAELNTGSDELGPELSADGQYLYFYSDRPAGQGGYDIWVARRDGSSWSAPQNLGERINTPYNEYGPALAAGDQRLFFTSNRPRTRRGPAQDGPAWRATLREDSEAADYDIFVAGMVPFDTEQEPGAAPPTPAFRIPQRVEALNSPRDEGQVALTRRGDFIYFSSDRKGGYGAFDLYRSRIHWNEFGTVENLGAAVNTEASEMDPTLHAEGFGLYFSTNRDAKTPGSYRLFRTLSREVMVKYDLGLLATLTALAVRMKWWILALVAAIAAILFLLQLLGTQRLQQGLLGRCLAGSVLAHAIVLFLLSLWILSSEVVKSLGEPALEIDMNALARERLSVEIREEVTELTPSEAVVVTQQQFERMPVPELQPPEPRDTPVIEVADTTESFMTEMTPVEPAQTTTPKLKETKLTSLDSLKVMPMAMRMEERRPEQAEPAESRPIRQAEEAVELAQHVEQLDVSRAAPQGAEPHREHATDDALDPLTPTPVSAGEVAAAASVRQVTVTNMLAMRAFRPTLAMEVAQARPQPGTAAAQARARQIALQGPADPGAQANQPVELARLDANVAGRASAIATELAGQPGPTAKVFDHREGEPMLPRLEGMKALPGMQLPSMHVASRIKLEAPEALRTPYLLRRPEERSDMINDLGGDSETEATVRRALDWLTDNQEPDGHWDIEKHGGEKQHDTASTSFALLCYFGWGATHKEDGPYRKTVDKGIKWLVARMKENGDLRGDRPPQNGMYDQGVAAMALTEAYGLTRDPALLEPARKAIEFILHAQDSKSGGWRYQPNSGSDTSVFGWQYMALKSAHMSGVMDTTAAMQKAERWLDHVGAGKHGGLYGYQNKGDRRGAMPPEGMFCRQLSGVPPSAPKMQETADYLKSNLPSAGKSDFYYWYYGTLALYQHQGPTWVEWNDRMKAILLSKQLKHGGNKGSWNPEGQWHNRMGRVVSTAMATLTLEVYYRYLPLYGIGGSPDAIEQL